jgi:hypothetical protein
MYCKPRTLTLGLVVLSLLGVCCVRLVLDSRYETSVVTNKKEEKVSSPHWAFLPLGTTFTDGNESTDNPIDVMIGKKLGENGLRIGKRAEKLNLLRRLTFDFTGLPPTTQEQEDYHSDQATDAYEKVVDRLLHSKRFGEHMAQDWLDLVRYADTDGSKSDNIRPDAYKYRDYVIQSINNDMPYDRFVRQQIAGDELEPDNPEALIATGFLRLGQDDPDNIDLEKRNSQFLDEVTEVVGKVFLGMTFGCARCHDHKFDPISQKEYYQFRSFFAGIVPRDDLPAVESIRFNEYRQKLLTWESATASIQAQINSLVGPYLQEIREDIIKRYSLEIQAIVRKLVDQRSPREQQLALFVEKELSAACDIHLTERLPLDKHKKYQKLQEALNSFVPKRPGPLPTVMGVGEVGREAPPTILPEGDRRPNKETVEPSFPQIFGNAALESHLDGTVASSGRRSALARWITRPDHPLTARVIVNRIWQHYFGVGLVETSNDFGKQAKPPTHPGLLDLLAVELVKNGWSLKHIHRLIVTSKTYCQSSSMDAATACPKALEIDPGNRLLWHSRRRRLKAEEIRDAMLAVAGDLILRTNTPINDSDQGVQFNRQQSVHLFRSIYLTVNRNHPDLLLASFDRPDRCESCPERSTTTSACQALAMLNGDLAVQRAHRWATRLLQRFGENTRDLVIQAYREAWGRPPEDEEISIALSFLDRQGKGLHTTVITADYESPMDAHRLSKDSVAQFCLALLNCNEFLYVD